VPRILRIKGADGEPIGTAESGQGVQRILEGLPPGRYHVDEISRDPLPCGHTSRRWGVGIKHGDGTFALDPDPWRSRTDDTQFPETGV